MKVTPDSAPTIFDSCRWLNLAKCAFKIGTTFKIVCYVSYQFWVIVDASLNLERKHLTQKQKRNNERIKFRINEKLSEFVKSKFSSFSSLIPFETLVERTSFFLYNKSRAEKRKMTFHFALYFPLHCDSLLFFFVESCEGKVRS